MKKYLFVVILVVFVFTLTGCSSSDDEDVEKTSIPYSRLSFDTLDEESQYVGTYSIQRENLGQKWDEYGEWTETELLFDEFLHQNNVCFGYFGMSNKGYFNAAEGYSWDECKFEGRDCLCLEKDNSN